MSPDSSNGYRGVLKGGSSGFRWGLVPSVGVHLGLLGLFSIPGLWQRTDRPLIDKDIYMVSAVVLPKAEGLPDKATAPPPKPAGEEGKAPEAPILEGEMILKKKEAPKKEQPKKKPQKKPEKKPQ